MKYITGLGIQLLGSLLNAAVLFFPLWLASKAVGHEMRLIDAYGLALAMAITIPFATTMVLVQWQKLSASQIDQMLAQLKK